MSSEIQHNEKLAGDAGQAATTTSSIAANSRAPLRWGALACGIAGALLAWLLLLQWYPFFVHAMAATNSSSPGPPSEEDLAMLKLYKYRNALAASGLMTALLAACLACGTGIRSGSVRYCGIGTCSGFVLGGALGALAGWCAQKVFDWPTLFFLGELPRTLVVQAVLWPIAGIGVGLAAGLPSWRWKTVLRALVSALIGGLLAAIVYPVAWGVIGILFPSVEGDQLIPGGPWQRLVWLFTAGTCIGAAVAWLMPELSNDSAK